jgi:hypothetical protein
LLTLLTVISLPAGADLSAINARPGDVVQLAAGTYRSFPKPVAGVAIVGQGPSTVLPGGSLRARATLRNVRVAGDLSLEYGADGAELWNIVVDGSFATERVSHFTVVGITAHGPYLNVNKWALSTTPTMGGSITHSTFDGIGKGVLTGSHPIEFWNCDSLEFAYNHVVAVSEATSTVGIEVHYADFNGSSHDNRFDYTLNGPVHDSRRWRGNTDPKLRLANGSDHNTFVRDSTYMSGPGSTIMYLSSSSTCDGSLEGCNGAWRSTMKDCVIDLSGLQGGSEIAWQGGMVGWTVTGSVLAANGCALHAFDVHGSTVRGNTLVGARGPTVRWTDEYGRPVDSLFAAVVANNVIASFDGSAPLVTYAPRLVQAGAFSAFYNLYQRGPLPAVYEYQTRVADPLFVSGKPGAFDPHLRVGSPALTGPWGRVGACGVKP